MKIQELAKELDMDVTVVLKKAQSMGYNVADKDSMLEGVDGIVVKNALIHAKDKAETKVVKAAPKKSEKKADEPKVTVKAANIPMPTQKKTQKAAPAKAQEKAPTQKPPVGKPVVNKDLEKYYDRLCAVQDYAREYSSFTGCEEGTEWSVKFIYKTDSIGE